MVYIALALALLMQLAGTARAADAPTTAPVDRSPGWMPLFNGQNLENFYTFRPTEGKSKDPQSVFKVENGMIHILDVADTTKPQEAGYVATVGEYRNYRVRLEYKWGTKKFPFPGREGQNPPRDSGLLYHLFGNDAVWPQSMEFQIQEHDAGDVYLLNAEPRPHVTATVSSEAPKDGIHTYAVGGAPTTIPSGNNPAMLKHSAEYDSLTDWNSVELLVNNDEAVYVVNGHVNNRVKQMRVGSDGKPLTQGRIALQAEHNEISYRNVQIKPLLATYGGPSYKVLVFSKTAAFRHASIPDGIAAIKLLGQQNNFTVDATEDANAFTDENLKQYKALVFMSTTGDVFNDAQQQALVNYIHNGGGYVGVHSASDTEFDWPWYGKLVGAYFSRHPAGTPTATVKLEDPNDISMSSAPLSWTRVDEWYNFRQNPRTNDVHVLATLDETSYQGGEMNGDHPIIWKHDFEGGRAWYTALGHTKESYRDPLFLFQLLGGIQYAAGTDGTPPKDAVVLFDGKDASHWTKQDGSPIGWVLNNGLLESRRAGNIYSKESFDDCVIHVEFKVPAVAGNWTNAGDQAFGNSGVYIQGRYEQQILDSFDHPLQDKNDLGAIYLLKDADVNAALPAESWQTYDIHFRAPRWNGNAKTANARLTTWLNGVMVQNNVEVPNKTGNGSPEGPTAAPLVLQDHANPVQFRNIWVKRILKE